MSKQMNNKQMNTNPPKSILNNVLGPVMHGPSSSHSAAPFAIAQIARNLSTSNGETIVQAEVRFDPNGSFARVYTNQGSDEGFAAGLLGGEMLSPLYMDALQKIERDEATFNLDFKIIEIKNNNHPNAVEIALSCRLEDSSLREDLYSATSTGGGMIVVHSLNYGEIEFDGQTAAVIARGDDSFLEDVSQICCSKGILISEKPFGDDGRIYRTSEVLSNDEISEISQKSTSETALRQTTATQYVVVGAGDVIMSVDDIERYGDVNVLHACVEKYEGDLLGKTQLEIRSLFAERLDVMLQSVESGFNLKENKITLKYLKSTASKIRDEKKCSRICGDQLHHGISAALAVMELCTSRGILCAAPTAGSAGILPGVLYSLREEGIPRERLIDALEVMGLVGLVIAQRATFAAECCGCAAETGAAAAMAAGGIAYVYGGTSRAVFNAASICSMNTLGLVCDPVGGEVEIPCHSRNIAGIGHAYTAAASAVGGFDAVIPFDEVVDSLLRVGNSMHSDVLCTGMGGLAVTQTAFLLNKEQDGSKNKGKA